MEKKNNVEVADLEQDDDIQIIYDNSSGISKCHHREKRKKNLENGRNQKKKYKVTPLRTISKQAREIPLIDLESESEDESSRLQPESIPPANNDGKHSDEPPKHETTEKCLKTLAQPCNNTSSVCNKEDLYQYIGNISDVDFNDIEMDVDVRKEPIICTNKVVENHSENKQVSSENHSENKQVSGPSIKQAKSNHRLPLWKNAAGTNILRFFWWDAVEDSYKHPGIVYLFGKIFVESSKAFASCCIAIKNVPRRIYVLPKEDISKDNLEEEKNLFDSLYNELKEYMHRNSIHEFRCKQVKKNYAFNNPAIPRSADYLEVRYSAEQQIDLNHSSPGIEAILGSTTSALELFLLEKNLSGPCWLDIQFPSSYPQNGGAIPFSYCKFEVNTRIEDVRVSQSEICTPDAPPLVTATLYVQVSSNAKIQENEVVNVTILIQREFYCDKKSASACVDECYSLITKPRQTTNWSKGQDATESYVIWCETEIDLLDKLLDTLERCDPDIIIGYDTSFQFDILYDRISTYRLKQWSKLGKLRRFVWPTFKGKVYLSQIFMGRPIIDIQSTMKELNLKLANYDLKTLVAAVLPEEKCETIESEQCEQYFVSKKQVGDLVRSTKKSAKLILEVATRMDLLALAVQMTNIAGYCLSRIVTAGIGERNDCFLMHAFHCRDYIFPERKKEQHSNAGSKNKLTFTGGLVLEPKQGFYDTLVLLMDFNSLYPSIIQEFNICFTTIDDSACDDCDVNKLTLPDSEVQLGVLGSEIKKLVESRNQLKKMKSSAGLSAELKQRYDTRQLALKLMANSVYGCLGSARSRFASRGLAALITKKGREILLDTKKLLQSQGFEVIYGDTDSLMIDTKSLDYVKVLTIGRGIKKSVNKCYKRLELDIERVYKSLLMLKKKQYAALVIDELPNGSLNYIKEIKGLEVVNRGRCKIACDTGNRVLDVLLSRLSLSNEKRVEEIACILKTVSKNVKSGCVPLDQLEIHVQLTKEPEQYTKRDNLPHVIVAQRLNKSSARKWRAGDLVAFAICEDGTSKKWFERSYHRDEIKRSAGHLKVDVGFYLTNQIYPMVSKICTPIDYITDECIAQHLGINPKSIGPKCLEKHVPWYLEKNRYEKCVPFTINCKSEKCRSEIKIQTVISDLPGGAQLSLSRCCNLNCDIIPWKSAYSIQNKLQLDIRRFISKYYRGEVECDNSLCSRRTRILNLDSSNCLECNYCSDGTLIKIYKESDLFDQLHFFLNIFSLTESHLKELKMSVPSDLIQVYKSLKEFMIDEIDNNAYGSVDFSMLFPPKMQHYESASLNSHSCVNIGKPKDNIN